MKQTLLLITALVVAGFSPIFSQTYNPGDPGSEVKFVIKNLGLNVSGTFTGLQGEISFDPSNLSGAVFNVSVSAATVNTSNSTRDRHLRDDDYFDVKKYPNLSFASSRITSTTTAGLYNLEGVLTIKGKAKKINFPFNASYSKNGYLFTGKFTINRRDFNVGGSSWVLSDDLTVTLTINAQKS